MAGTVLSGVLTSAVLTGWNMVGRPIAAALYDRPIVGMVEPESPAERAGLQVGDEILRIDGEAQATSAEALVAVGIRPDAAYPAVVEHPVTGRKVLEVVEQFLDRIVEPQKAGLTPDEADDLLRRLIAHTRRPEFHYFHKWEPGDMILWDNWRVMHCTTGTKPGVKRVINRTTIEGDAQLGRQLEAPAA